MFPGGFGYSVPMKSWVGFVILGGEWAIFVGHGGTTPWHSCLAYKLAIGLDHPLTVHTTNGQARTGMIVPIPPGTNHQVVTRPEWVASFYADAGAFPLAMEPTEQESAALRRFCLQLAEDFAADHSAAMHAVELPKPIELDHRMKLAVSHLSEPVSPAHLAAIAAETGLSQSRFSHLFAATIGGPPVRYRRWRRLRHAAERLAAGESIVDAALAAGFSDSAHLTRTFVEMLGVTPGLFQENRIILVADDSA
jgi:AraC-like DNA-binding protein